MRPDILCLAPYALNPTAHAQIVCTLALRLALWLYLSLSPSHPLSLCPALSPTLSCVYTRVCTRACARQCLVAQNWILSSDPRIFRKDAFCYAQLRATCKQKQTHTDRHAFCRHKHSRVILGPACYLQTQTVLLRSCSHKSFDTCPLTLVWAVDTGEDSRASMLLRISLSF